MDSLTITIIFIILSTVFGAFIKGRMRDKCLLSFEGDLVNIELKDGKTIRGILRLEATGLELKYKEPDLDINDSLAKTSFILYKNEYVNIQCITRFLVDLNEKDKKKRARFLKRIYNQKGLSRIKNKIRNFFATVKDSIMEVVNLLIGKAKQVTPLGRVLSSQDKYVSKIQTEAFSSLNTSFEPLFEKHMGKKVILQLSKQGKIIEYSGILKGYTAQFLEFFDLAYRCSEKEEIRPADIVVPRSVGIIRHLGE